MLQKNVDFFPIQKLAIAFGRTGRLNSIDHVPYYVSELDCVIQRLGWNSMGLEHSPRRKWSSISAAVLKKLGVHFLYVTRGQYFKGNSPQLGTKVTIEVAPVTLQGATGNTRSRRIPKPLLEVFSHR